MSALHSGNFGPINPMLTFLFPFLKTITIFAFLPAVDVFRFDKNNVSSYIAQYPILRIAQSALHFTSPADLLNQTPSQLLWESSSHMLQLMREGCSYTYPQLVYSQVLIYTAE